MHYILVPVGSSGDVFPFLGIGTTLRRRGHRVTLLTNAHFEKDVRRGGMDFVSLGTEEEYEAATHSPDLWHPTRCLPFVLRLIAEGTEQVYRVIESEYRPGSTVVVAATLALGARVAREKLGVPTASVHLQPSILRSVHQSMGGVPILPQWAPAWYKRSFFWLLDRFLIDPILDKPVNGFRAQLELPPARRFFGDWLHSPDLILGMFPEWFAAKQIDWPDRVLLTGFPCFDGGKAETLDPRLEEFLQAGERPIAFSFGSAMRQAGKLFDVCLEACRRIGRRAVVVTPFSEQIPSSLEPQFHHADFAPFGLLFPRVAVAVHHGGIGTSSQGLAAGVPQLIVPFAHDQPDNASKLQALGVARSLWPNQATPERMAAVLEELLKDRYRVRANELAQLLATDNGLDRACDALEEFSRRTLSR